MRASEKMSGGELFGNLDLIQEEIETLKPLILGAKNKILEMLRGQESNSVEEKKKQILQSIEEITGIEWPEKIEELNKSIQITQAEDLRIDFTGVVFLGREAFGMIDNFDRLSAYEKNLLKAECLFNKLLFMNGNFSSVDFGLSSEEQERDKWHNDKSKLEQVLQNLEISKEVDLSQFAA